MGKQNSYVYHPQRKYSKIYYLRQNTTGKDEMTDGGHQHHQQPPAVITSTTTSIPIAKDSTNEGRQLNEGVWVFSGAKCKINHFIDFFFFCSMEE